MKTISCLLGQIKLPAEQLENTIQTIEEHPAKTDDKGYMM